MKIKGAHDSDNIYGNKMPNSTTGIVYSLIGITLFVGVFLSNIVPNVSADTSVVSTAVIDVPSSCSMTATVDTAHSATLINGIYSGGNDYYPNGIGKTTLTAFCNDASGFAIYAVGFSGDEYGATNMIGTNTGTTIPTGTATSGANSQWAMKLTKVTDATAYNPANMTITNGYDDYSAVPDDYEKVANFSSATDQTLGAKLTTTYAAYISNTQAADTYTGKVKYTLVHPATSEPNKPQTTTAGKIGYFPNAGNSVEDTMGDQSISSSDTSATLWASNFKRPGYGFAGWTDKFDWVLGANDANGNGTGVNAGYHIYGPNQTIEFTAGQYSNKGLSLYAVWVPSAGNLQNWSGCSSLAQGAVAALTDQRDNNTYAVAKLADGKCWMIENLRLDNTNSDNATGALAQGYGTSATYGNFIGLANPETANFQSDNPVAANSLYKADGSGDIFGINGAILTDIGTANNPSYRIPRFRNDNTNSDSVTNPNTTVANMTGVNQNVYSYGNYYNWAAAKASTDYFANANSNNVLTSICPKGWRLPIGTGSGDFGVLSNSLGGYKNQNNVAQLMTSSTTPTGEDMSKRLRAFPNNFVYSGSVSGRTVSRFVYGGLGLYWTATASHMNYAYYISFGDGSNGNDMVAPGTFDGMKYYGYAVRCVLPPSN